MAWASDTTCSKGYKLQYGRIQQTKVQDVNGTNELTLNRLKYRV